MAANALMHAIVYGSSTLGRKVWDELQPFEREHLTKTVLQAPIRFDIPGRTIPKKPNEKWGYFNTPSTPSGKAGAYFTFPADDGDK
jgi:hypothetical protein